MALGALLIFLVLIWAIRPYLKDRSKEVSVPRFAAETAFIVLVCAGISFPISTLFFGGWYIDQPSHVAREQSRDRLNGTGPFEW